MPTPSFDLELGHRWFAVELNNTAWDLVERPDLSEAETHRMIHAAHGACFHWLEVGGLLHHLRAQCLLAAAYVEAGLAEAALRHARHCLALSGVAGDTQTPFDHATAHGCMAAAYRLAENFEASREQYAFAQAASAGLNDPADLAVFNKLFPDPG